MSAPWPRCILHQRVLFCAAMRRSATVIHFHHLQNVVCILQVLFRHNTEWLLRLCALISDVICPRVAALHCATGHIPRMVSASTQWWEETSSNFYFHLQDRLFRRSNNYLLYSLLPPPCLLSPSPSLALASPRPRLLSPSRSFSRARPISALFIPWRMHLKPCKWEQVNKWMFHECFYDEKMQMRMSEWMNV